MRLTVRVWHTLRALVILDLAGMICCMCFSQPWIACLFLCFVTLQLLVWLCSTSYRHLLFFVVYFIFILTFLIPDIGWMHFLCVCVCVVTSCPVLEFELRKAKETIQALRANLTQAAGVAYFKLLPNLNLLFSFPHLFLVFLRDVSLHCCLTSCCQMF